MSLAYKYTLDIRYLVRQTKLAHVIVFFLHTYTNEKKIVKSSSKITHDKAYIIYSGAYKVIVYNFFNIFSVN